MHIRHVVVISDGNFHDGMEPNTFESAVEHVMKSCFGYDRMVSKIVQHEYTNWRQRDDPVELRRQYINVRSRDDLKSPVARAHAGCGRRSK